MTATGHAVIGTVIAAKVGNPTLAIPLAIASHFIADMLPHWDELADRRTKAKSRLAFELLLDGLLAIAVSYLLTFFLFPQTNYSYVLLLVVFSILPDFFHAPFSILGIKLFEPIYKFGKIFDKKMKNPWGIMNQIAILIAIVLLGKLL